MRIVTVVGARPQFVKAAALSPVLRRRHDEYLVHTGQHYDQDMSGAFFDELGIPPPDVNLGVGSGTHGQQTAAMLTGIEQVLLRERPDAVLLYGDTNSTLAGALAASKMHVPIGHVEAGLRSGDRRMPEEINRILSDHVSDGLYCPTRTAVANLRREGLTKGVHLVGDVMVDLFQRFEKASRADEAVARRHGLEPGAYWLVTLHRPSNTDDARRLKAILAALERSGERFLWPVHPRAKARLDAAGLKAGGKSGAIVATTPLPYREAQAALLHSAGVVTDSGGLQKEAILAGKRCLTVRDSTEWPETLKGGWNRLVEPKGLAQALAGPAPRGKPPRLWNGPPAAQTITRLVGELA